MFTSWQFFFRGTAWYACSYLNGRGDLGPPHLLILIPYPLAFFFSGEGGREEGNRGMETCVYVFQGDHVVRSFCHHDFFFN